MPPLAARFVCYRGFHAIGLVFGGYDVFGAERPTEMGVGSGFRMSKRRFCIDEISSFSPFAPLSATANKKHAKFWAGAFPRR